MARSAICWCGAKGLPAVTKGGDIFWMAVPFDTNSDTERLRKTEEKSMMIGFVQYCCAYLYILFKGSLCDRSSHILCVAVFIAAVVEQRKADPDIENDVTSPRR